MNESEKIIRKYRHRIPLEIDEIQLLVFALKHYTNRTLINETKKLIQRLEKILTKVKQK